MFKEVACTYHVSKFYVTDLVLKLQPHQTVFLPKKMTQISF